jgi:hypothetical protein
MERTYTNTYLWKKTCSNPDQATGYAQTFMNNNGLGYNLGTPEIYPGYYKFTPPSGSRHGYHGGWVRWRSLDEYVPWPATQEILKNAF